jgi:hypothetical protein
LKEKAESLSGAGQKMIANIKGRNKKLLTNSPNIENDIRVNKLHAAATLKSVCRL